MLIPNSTILIDKVQLVLRLAFHKIFSSKIYFLMNHWSLEDDMINIMVIIFDNNR